MPRTCLCKKSWKRFMTRKMPSKWDMWQGFHFKYFLFSYGYHCSHNSYFINHNQDITEKIFGRLRNFQDGKPNTVRKIVNLRDFFLLLTLTFDAVPWSSRQHLSCCQHQRPHHWVWLHSGRLESRPSNRSENSHDHLPSKKWYFLSETRTKMWCAFLVWQRDCGHATHQRNRAQTQILRGILRGPSPKVTL